MRYPTTQLGKMTAHLAGALVATVAYAATELLDPDMVRLALALIVAGNMIAVVLAYLNLI